jgi:hypothetical protein
MSEEAGPIGLRSLGVWAPPLCVTEPSFYNNDLRHPDLVEAASSSEYRDSSEDSVRICLSAPLDHSPRLREAE